MCALFRRFPASSLDFPKRGTDILKSIESDLDNLVRHGSYTPQANEGKSSEVLSSDDPNIRNTPYPKYLQIRRVM
jgi:hypothetical protein